MSLSPLSRWFAEPGLHEPHAAQVHASSGVAAANPAEPTQPLQAGQRTDVHPPRPALHTGALGGRYRLEGRLGSGGLGTVWAGYDLVLSRPVAIKTLPADLPENERKRRSQRFLDEARAAARLSHPNIVSVHDAGVDARGAYIVMTLLHGKDLRRLLDEGWRPSPNEACRIVSKVAQALDYAHEHGVVHRDVKPSNIVLTSRLQPMVLDFGQAHTGDVDHDELAALGSPYYAAPEQFEGHPADRRTDIYALGVVLYELLTGVRPHAGRTLDEIQDAVQGGAVTPLSQHRGDLPAALEAVVLRAMARKAGARFHRADELARALRPWVRTAPEKVMTRKSHHVARLRNRAADTGGWLQRLERLGAWVAGLSGRRLAGHAAPVEPVLRAPAAER